MIGLCNFMRNLCNTAQMSWEVAALPFQVHTINGTRSIDFAIEYNLFLFSNLFLSDGYKNREINDC